MKQLSLFDLPISKKEVANFSFYDEVAERLGLNRVSRAEILRRIEENENNYLQSFQTVDER